MKVRHVTLGMLAGAVLAAGVTAAIAIPGPPAERPLFASLNGNNEIGEDGNRGAGDPNGRGSFNAIIEEGQLCFGISVANIGDPVAAHIHRGNRRVNGPIVVPLTEPDAGDPGTSSGCVDIAARLRRAIRRNPGNYYANVHTEEFPAGAVRGQLFRR
jgi:hypothetical protein